MGNLRVYCLKTLNKLSIYPLGNTPSAPSASSSENKRVYSEVYNSDAFIEEHDHLQRHGQLPPDDPHCKREKVIAALMFWSNAMHLAQFGTMKL